MSDEVTMCQFMGMLNLSFQVVDQLPGLAHTIFPDQAIVSVLLFL